MGQGEAVQELFELVAARDAALTESVRLKGELEATISDNTSTQSPLLQERDELVSARDKALSEAARLVAELEALRCESMSAAAVSLQERDEVLASRNSALNEVGCLAAKLDAVHSQHSLLWAESRVERDELLSARNASLTVSDRVVAELEHARVESMTLSEAAAKDRLEVTTLREAADAQTVRHQEVSSRCEQVVDELNRLRTEHSVACSDGEEMRASLDMFKQEEAGRLSQSTGPQPLSVSDVLITVVFEGVQAPVLVRPWDTNFDEVAREWLAENKKSAGLKDSLAAYLKHLEETSDAFPVRMETSLLEVHEKYSQ